MGITPLQQQLPKRGRPEEQQQQQRRRWQARGGPPFRLFLRPCERLLALCVQVTRLLSLSNQLREWEWEDVCSSRGFSYPNAPTRARVAFSCSEQRALCQPALQHGWHRKSYYCTIRVCLSSLDYSVTLQEVVLRVYLHRCFSVYELLRSLRCLFL